MKKVVVFLAIAGLTTMFTFGQRQVAAEERQQETEQLSELQKAMVEWQAEMLKLQPEFQKAIEENFDQLEIKSSIIGKRRYTKWIYPYLYYFDVNFDNREGISDKKLIDGKRSLMLVPLGAKKPTVFQIRFPMNDFIYTHSLEDFYKKPNK